MQSIPDYLRQATLDSIGFIGPESHLLKYSSSAWIGYGTYFAKNLAVQLGMLMSLCPIAPLLPFSFTFLLPDFPKWLIWDGPNARAWEIIQKMRHDPTENQDLAAHAEYILIEKQFAYDKEIKVGYIQISLSKH